MKIMVMGVDPIFSADFAWGFRALGHDVTLQNGFNVESEMKRLQPELIVTLGSPAYYLGTQIPAILSNRKAYTNAKLVHWDTDGITWEQIETQLIEQLKPDVVFTMCPDMLALLLQKDITAYPLAYAFSPATHKPMATSGENTGEIGFVGSAYPTVMLGAEQHMRKQAMAMLIPPLLQAKEEVHLWGDPPLAGVLKSALGYEFPHAHGRLAYAQTALIYSKLFVNLVPQNHLHHLTKRTYEILGCGGFILTVDTPAVRALFQDGKELAISTSPEETVQLVKFYRENPDAYAAVRKNALAASETQTYRERAETILEKTFG